MAAEGYDCAVRAGNLPESLLVSVRLWIDFLKSTYGQKGYWLKTSS